MVSISVIEADARPTRRRPDSGFPGYYDVTNGLTAALTVAV